MIGIELSINLHTGLLLFRLESRLEKSSNERLVDEIFYIANCDNSGKIVFLLTENWSRLAAVKSTVIYITRSN